jgi:class 3 adenylate cyclase/tetratricopeptide (TPR) repeat protein
MTCPNCGTINPAGARFCLECGNGLSLGCRSCGSALAPGAKFCSNCGTPTADGAARPESEKVAAGSATSSAPVAERRLVSVLFVDLVGFTTIAEGHDAEDTRDLLTRYFELAREVIERYGGTVEKFIGDAVMAVWGAPVAHENDAERAVRAALDLIGAVPTLRDGLSARAGVLSGEAAVTLGATNQGMVAGDLVNTASRLQSVAPPGSVLVGEGTQHAASAAIVFEPIDEQQLKGKTAPVAAYRAVRVIAERGGRGRPDRLEAALVGRDDELRLLKDLFHATAREKRPRILSITGQAGVGKSRITRELSRYLDGIVETVYWHSGRSPAYGEGITFWALGEMVRERAGLAESDDEGTTRAKLAAAVEQWIPDEQERRWVERALLALLGLESSGQSTREELFSAWRTFFERIAAVGPTVLVFEDLEWADTGMLDFIDHLLEWSRGVPLLMITLARPELIDRRKDWGAGRKNFVALSLEPLLEPAMRNLLGGLVPGLPERAARSIVARADGIPLYAMETVRMLVAEGKLVEAEGAYRPSADLSAIAVPETLQALITARLDGLDQVERSLVQDGAVLGQSFTVAALAAVSGMDAAAVEEHLRVLVRRELLVHESDPRSPERGQYAFVQALIREVAYGTLAKPDRRSRHLAAARYFESLGEEELAGALAAHYLAAYRASAAGPEAKALAAQARVSLKAAASRAASLGSPEQAAIHFAQAVEVTDDPAEAADLLEQAGVTERAAGRYDAAEKHLRAAIERWRELGDPVDIARATGLLGQALVGPHNELAIELLEPAVAEFGDLGDHAALAFIEHQLARAHWLSGHVPIAIELADRAIGRAERIDDLPLIADAMITKGSLISGTRSHEGMALLRAGQQLAEANGFTAISVRGLLNIGASAYGIDPRQAQDVARETITIARRLGLRSQLAIGAGNALEGAVQVGDWEWAEEEAARLLDEDLEAADRFAVYRGIEELRSYQGKPVEDLLEPHHEHVEGSGNATNISNYQGGLAARKFAAGDYAGAAAAWLQSAELNSTNTASDLPHAIRAALWARDRATVENLREQYEALHVHGPAPAAWRLTIAAALAAFDGRRDDAIAQYAEARGRWADSGVVFEGSLVSIDMLVTLGPDEPAVRAAVAETRAILVRLGARPFLELIDHLMAGALSTEPPTREASAATAKTR